MGQQAIGMIVVAGDATAVKAAANAGAAVARSVGGESVSVEVISRLQDSVGATRTAGLETPADTADATDSEHNLEQATQAFGSPGAQNGSSAAAGYGNGAPVPFAGGESH